MNELDQEYWIRLRNNIKDFLKSISETYPIARKLVLDVAPQVYEGAKEFFKDCTIETLDIDPEANCTYTEDLCWVCLKNTNLWKKFDYIVCTEVLEHVENPTAAAFSLKYMLKPGGYVFVSTPCNFCIHDPLPDYWRFTEYGLRQLFSEQHWDIIEIKPLLDESRPQFPIQYTLIARSKV